jgi:hypothetical protein|tara:strand:- start:1975 stop:2163 length:189 start_codon:yes stop_codon:yes gene_type:complete
MGLKNWEIGTYAFLTDKEINKRMDICKVCEHYGEITRLCKKCGCFLPLKTVIKKWKCPIGKW